MQHLISEILRITQAKSVRKQEFVQSVWSGFGSIQRLHLEGGKYPSVVVKHIQLSNKSKHPKDWNTDHSYRRKVKSYKVENHWYTNYAMLCEADCKVPEFLGFLEISSAEKLLILEDLDGAGYPLRKEALKPKQCKIGLKWLANFHATFMHTLPKGLWDVGTYWHLDTRPEELKAMGEGLLKEKAQDLDSILNQCQFPTLVHGDAKVANFCFSPQMEHAAAVDFQYVGGGCGIKDVVYFFGSCLSAEECEKHEKELLDYYFKTLVDALRSKHPDIDAHAVEKEYRSLYAIAWSDFTRFMQGWSPTHKKLNNHSEKLQGIALDQIESRAKRIKKEKKEIKFTCGIDPNRDKCGDAM